MSSARENMVKQQVRAWGVQNPQVLDLMLGIPREKFVAPAYRAVAYADIALDVGHGRQMLSPSIQGKMLDVLDIQLDETALILGTDLGYLTALVARLAKHVYSFDLSEACLKQAEKNLLSEGVTNITLEKQEQLEGAPMYAPFDLIILTAAVNHIPDALLSQLNTGGRLFAILGHAPLMRAVLIEKDANSSYSIRVLYETMAASMFADEKSTATFLF